MAILIDIDIKAFGIGIMLLVIGYLIILLREEKKKKRMVSYLYHEFYNTRNQVYGHNQDCGFEGYPVREYRPDCNTALRANRSCQYNSVKEGNSHQSIKEEKLSMMSDLNQDQNRSLSSKHNESFENSSSKLSNVKKVLLRKRKPSNKLKQTQPIFTTKGQQRNRDSYLFSGNSHKIRSSLILNDKDDQLSKPINKHSTSKGFTDKSYIKPFNNRQT